MMSEISFVCDKSTKQILNLAQSIKNRDGFSNKVIENLLEGPDNTRLHQKGRPNRKFSNHPPLLSSATDLTLCDMPLKNGYLRQTLSYAEKTVTYHSVRRSESDASQSSKENDSCFDSSDQSQNGLYPIQNHLSKSRSSMISQTEDDFVGDMQFQHDDRNSPGSRDSQLCITNIQEKSSKKKMRSKASTISSIGAYAASDNKLRNLLPKIISCLEEMRLLMNDGTSLPDGDDEWERRRNKVAEFNTRIQRTYLYQLEREIQELQRLTRTPESILVSGKIHNYLASSHQVLYNALKAFRTHMVASLPYAIADKLKIILGHTSALCELHRKCMAMDQIGTSRRENLVETLSRTAEDIFETVEDYINTVDEVTVSMRRKFSTSSVGTFKIYRKPRRPRSNLLQGRFSMYSVTNVITTARNQNKTFSLLTTDKYHYVRSRYRSAGFKHRPPVPKSEMTIDLTSKSRVSKKPSCLVQTPIKTIRNDDDIPTMVGMHKEPETNNNNSTNGFCNGLANLQQTSVENGNKAVFAYMINQLYSRRQGKDMTQETMGNFVRELMGMDLHGKINSSNQETGSEKNGCLKPDNFNFANAVLEGFEYVNKQAIEASIDEHRRPNGVVTNHLTEKIADRVAQSGDKSIEKQEKEGQNGEADAIVLKNLDRTSEIVDIRKKSNCETNENNHKKRQTVTVRGVSNAKLYEITNYDGSLTEPLNGSLTIPENNENEDNQSPSQLVTDNLYNKGIVREDQIHITYNKVARDYKDTPRYREPCITVPSITEEYLSNILHYRQQFCKYVKKDSLYQKVGAVKPWILIGRLAESILNDAIIGVVNEIVLSPFSEDLFRAEFCHSNPTAFGQFAGVPLFHKKEPNEI